LFDGRTVPFGAENKFSIPLDIALYGEAENRGKVTQIFQKYHIVMTGVSKPPSSSSAASADGGMTASHVDITFSNVSHVEPGLRG
jgi:hypothetical protein